MRIASACIDAGVNYLDTCRDANLWRPLIDEHQSKDKQKLFFMLPCLTIEAQLPDLCVNVKIRDYVLPSQVISAEIVTRLNDKTFLQQLARSEVRASPILFLH
jgi:hypothetical protein